MFTWIMLIVIGLLLYGMKLWFLLGILIVVCLLHGWNHGEHTTRHF